MPTFRYMNSILTIDGKNYSVSLIQWAKMRLSDEEYQQFRTEMIEDVSKEYISLQERGILQVTYLTEHIKTDKFDIHIDIGEEASFPENILDYLSQPDTYNLEQFHHNIFLKWYDRMRQDPCITVFNGPERIN